MKRLIITLFVSFYGINSFAGEWSEHNIQIDKVQRWYRIYRPARAPLIDNMPMVVILHGGTGSMRKIFGKNRGGNRKWLEISDREGVILLAPNGTNARNGKTNDDNQNWNDLRPADSPRKSKNDDVSFLSSTIKEMIKTESVDPKRIFITGNSNGGMMTFRMLVEKSELFAGAAAYISSLPKDKKISKPDKAVPLIIGNGTEDKLVSWNGTKNKLGVHSTVAVPKLLQWWEIANQCDVSKKIKNTWPDRDQKDGCLIHQTICPSTENGAEVVFFKFEGGGHSTPTMTKAKNDRPRFLKRIIGNTCRDMETAEMTWAFFKKQMKN